MIDISIPSIIYAKCEVAYNGRASSKLELDNYLIIIKKDRSISINNCNGNSPINYQSSNSNISMIVNDYDIEIISLRKSEKILIKINELYWIKHPEEWSDASPKISKTEKDLVNKVVNNPNNYFSQFITNITPEMIKLEYPTPVGPIDIFIISDGKIIIGECKRTKITINSYIQLMKYVRAINFSDYTIYPIAIAPTISNKALHYADQHNLHYIRAEFD